jgi:hypothetical protein
VRIARRPGGRWRDFTVKHFPEQLVKRPNYVLGCTVTKLHLHRAGLVHPAEKRSAHRKKRPRRPMVGMILHQDASTHAWLPGDKRRYYLVVTMDDHQRAVFGLSGQRGGYCLEFSGAARGGRQALPVLLAL